MLSAGNPTFQVVLNGVHPSASPTAVREKLAVLFKASPEQIDQLLATTAYVVKKGITHEAATKYKSAIDAVGAVCSLVEEHVPVMPLDVDLPVSAPLAATSKVASAQPTPAGGPANKGSSTTVQDNAETVLFQGDASLLKGALKIVQGNALGTNQRFVFNGDAKGPITLQASDIASAQEIKHGLGTKWEVKTTAGETYYFLAANAVALRETMLTLTGQEELAKAAHKQPELSEVKNGTAWLAALGPILAGFIVLLIGAVFNWNWDDATTAQLFKLMLFKLALIYLFIRIDHLSLQQQGFNTNALGIVAPEKFPIYLFSRAKAFGHGKGYAITWCVLFGLEVLVWVL